MPAAVRNGRENNFNIMRVFAAMLVVYGHTYHLMQLPHPPFVNEQISSYGLYILFAVGGYLITCSWQHDPHPVRFMLRRVLRIWPPFACLILFTVFVLGPISTSAGLGAYFRGGALDYLQRSLRMYITYELPGVFAANPYPYAVNGALWSLPVEMLLYIVTMLILSAAALCGRYRDRLLIAVACFSCAAAYALTMLMASGRVDFSCVFYGIDLLRTLNIAPYFFVGMAFTVPGLKRLLNLQAALFLLLLLCMVSFHYAVTSLAMYIVLPYIVLSFCLCDKPVFAGFGRHAELSYGIYLYGWPVTQWVIDLCRRTGLPGTFAVVFPITAGITLILAYASCRLVEQPVQRLTKRLLSRG